MRKKATNPVIPMKEWRHTLNLMRFKCACALPVKVSRTKMPADTLGDTALNGGKSPHFSIRIDKNMNSEMTYATLAHEWAHCLAWSVGQQTIDDHGAEWGIAYAKVYCAIYDTT